MDRISAAQLADQRLTTEYLDAIEYARSGDAALFPGGESWQMMRLVREIRAVWGEAEAATRALKRIVKAAAPCVITDSTLSAAIDAARALVGSENRKADE